MRVPRVSAYAASARTNVPHENSPVVSAPCTRSGSGPLTGICRKCDATSRSKKRVDVGLQRRRLNAFAPLRCVAAMAIARSAIAKTTPRRAGRLHATTPLANDGAAISAAAPRSRGYCSGGTTVIGVAPAGGVKRALGERGADRRLRSGPRPR